MSGILKINNNEFYISLLINESTSNESKEITDNLVMEDIAKSISKDMTSESFCNNTESNFSDEDYFDN